MEPLTPSQPDRAAQLRDSTTSNVVKLDPKPAVEVEPQPDAAELVEKVREVTQSLQRSIEFTVSEDSGRTIIKVYDTNTDQLIREIPAKELQRMAEAIQNQLAEGIILQEEA